MQRRKFIVAVAVALSALASAAPADARCCRKLFRGGLLRRLCRPDPCCRRSCVREHFDYTVLLNKRCVVQKLITADGITIYLVEDCDTGATTSYFHTDPSLPVGGCASMSAHCYTPPQDNTMTISQPSLAVPASTPIATSVANGAYRITVRPGDTRTIKWHKFTVGTKSVRAGFEIAPTTPAAPFALQAIKRGMSVWEIQDPAVDPLPLLVITRP